MSGFTMVVAQHYDENHNAFPWKYEYHVGNVVQAYTKYDRWRYLGRIILNTPELLEIEYSKNGVILGWCKYILMHTVKRSMASKLWKEGSRCWYCGALMRQDGNSRSGCSLEHLHPVSKGGNYHKSNLVLAHPKCNSRAGAMMLCEKWKLKQYLTSQRMRQDAKRKNRYQSKCNNT